MIMVPETRPKLTREEALVYPDEATRRVRCNLLGLRGYYKKTMGDPAKNDRGIYDDAIVLIAPELYVTFNANVDPTVWRKWIAVLQPGVYIYKIGIHGLNKPPGRRYKALVQAGPVRVHRDNIGLDTGWFGINIHKGSLGSTSSEGCQTIYPTQWEEFITAVENQLKLHNQSTIPYTLRDA